MYYDDPEIIYRFLSNVDKNGPIPSHYPELGKCWLWIAGKNLQGYGRFKYNNKEIKAHRYSYKLYRKNYNKKLPVLHHCDNPPCVRPEHLWQGTYKDNTQDMLAKGRDYRKGESGRHHKLSEKNILKIRQLYKSGYSQQNIANTFSVTRSNISYIVNRKSWDHI